MKKLSIIFVAIAASWTVATAQEAPAIKFATLEHDFGTFAEETGKASYSFEFINTGTGDLILQNVKTSCGCTASDWTKTPVKAGEKGVVTATYNASGRPGSFNKTVTVISNAGEERLVIKGVVTPKVPKVEDQYPFDFSGLRIKTQYVYLNNVEYPSAKTEGIEVINTTANPIAIAFKDVPPYITLKVTPAATLQANEKGTIEVTLDSKAVKDWGMISPTFSLVLNDKEEDKKIGVNANIIENFAALTPEQKANAPVINIGGTITLGALKANKKNSVKFEVANDGKSELMIRKGTSDNEAIKVIVPTGAIKPGKKGDIKLEIDAAKLSPGKFSNRLTFITNDPNKSVISVQVEGEIQ